MRKLLLIITLAIFIGGVQAQMSIKKFKNGPFRGGKKLELKSTGRTGSGDKNCILSLSNHDFYYNHDNIQNVNIKVYNFIGQLVATMDNVCQDEVDQQLHNFISSLSRNGRCHVVITSNKGKVLREILIEK